MTLRRRILFVDDEPRILKGLQRMLHKMRKEWDIEFAEGGIKALEMLGNKNFDVVVTDMRMPGMDGLQLLTEVQKLYPNVVRIVLSGQSDQEMILKSVKPAHQYLSKPCNPEVLRFTVGRACALRDLLKDDTLKRIVTRTEYIPSLPSLHEKIVEALQKDVSIREIGKIISKDPAMTAKILQLVNSAFFGLPGHITDPEQAVQFLGIDTVKSLAFTIEVFSVFSDIISSEINIAKIYEHSLITGALARKIAGLESSEKEVIDNSFMAGMLHDIGKLILIANIPKEYLKVIKISRDDGISLYKAESKILGATHAEIGAYLLGLWGLPDNIVEAVAFHHSPRVVHTLDFAPLTAVYCANVTVNLKFAEPGEIVDYYSQQYLDNLNIGKKTVIWNELLNQINLGEDDD